MHPVFSRIRNAQKRARRILQDPRCTDEMREELLEIIDLLEQAADKRKKRWKEAGGTYGFAPDGSYIDDGIDDV
jgi:hypothetical protein